MGVSFPRLFKTNTHGTGRGYPGLTTCGGILRESMGEFIGSFFVLLNVQTALVVEFYGLIHAIEQAQKISLTSLWFECDFVLVSVAFTVMTNVPWMFGNRWHTCLNYCGKIRVLLTESTQDYAIDRANLRKLEMSPRKKP
ncbi:uncharacterized protein [Phaseolus vulgaris]|uniref:uncharacterized protein n=1 Tax=Phaseolus vulgaris TaxID=3885 RepID=UPI0035CA807D